MNVVRRIAACTALGIGCLSLGCSGASGQSPDLVYISNVSGVSAGSPVAASIEEQTAAALDKLGEELQSRGLDYSDVVASNVFLKDTRHFQGMNGVYRTYFETDAPTRATVQADLLDPSALFQISVVAARGPKQIIVPTRLKSPALPYSWGVRVGDLVFLSGATSRNPETYEPVAGDVAAQTTRVFGNLGLVLEEAGLSHADLVSCRVFIDDPRAFGIMNDAYRAFVSAEDPPARATVRAPLMNVLFSSEIQCVADASGVREVVLAEGQSMPRNPYSPGIDTGDRVYLAGLTAQGADATEETRTILGRMQTSLEAAGVSFADLEDVWVYLADIRDWDAVRAELEEAFGAGAPNPTVVGTRLMGRSRVEIQVIAKRD